MLCFICVSFLYYFVFFFKQKTAYEMRISDWSSDVCSSDLEEERRQEMERIRQMSGTTMFDANLAVRSRNYVITIARIPSVVLRCGFKQAHGIEDRKSVV